MKKGVLLFLSVLLCLGLAACAEQKTSLSAFEQSSGQEQSDIQNSTELLHWPFGNVYGAWRDLEKLYEEGKIRVIGVSNFEPDRLIDLISFNKVKPVINQIETHIYCQRHIEHEWEDKYGVAHQAYAPLGQGRANDMFEEEAIKRIADKYGKTPARVSLRFLLQNNVVIIPKSVHESRMKEADRGNVCCGLRFLCFSEVYYSRCTIR